VIMRTSALIVVMSVAGCATVAKTAVVDGKVVPRLSLDFTGQPYQIKHEGAHPAPGKPSGGLRDAGGRIHGNVCGMFVDFDVTHKGDHVQLVGIIDNRTPASIDVADDRGNMRHFTGSLGGLAIDFIAGSGGMQGHVGIRVFALEATSDDGYRGDMRIPGMYDPGGGKQTIGVTLRGRESLWAMPPADQAAILPAILTCGNTQHRILDDLAVGFGGKPTEAAPETSAVYTTM
jgi:hypothetical protein